MSAALSCPMDFLPIPNSNDRTYLWVDPGKSTGWATYTYMEDSFHSGEGAAHDIEEMLYWTFTGNYNLFHIYVGWELFLITPGSTIKHDGSALKVIGFLEWVTQHSGCSVLDPQPSSARNLGSSGGKLQRLGWYKPGQDDANAASAHLLAYMLRENKLPAHLMSKLLPEVD